MSGKSRATLHRVAPDRRAAANAAALHLGEALDDGIEARPADGQQHQHRQVGERHRALRSAALPPHHEPRGDRDGQQEAADAGSRQREDERQAHHRDGEAGENRAAGVRRREPQEAVAQRRLDAAHPARDERAEIADRHGQRQQHPAGEVVAVDERPERAGAPDRLPEAVDEMRRLPVARAKTGLDDAHEREERAEDHQAGSKCPHASAREAARDANHQQAERADAREAQPGAGGIDGQRVAVGRHGGRACRRVVHVVVDEEPIRGGTDLRERLGRERDQLEAHHRCKEGHRSRHRPIRSTSQLLSSTFYVLTSTF